MRKKSARHALLAYSGVGAVLTLTAASMALAAEPATTIRQDGLLQLPNVTIVNAPGSASEQTAAPTAGLRAFKDRETGQLRAPTLQDLQEEAAAAPVAAADPQATAIFPSANGGTIARLDGNAMAYSIAFKDASGDVRTDCVTDAASEDAALAMAATTKEHRHDH